MCVMIDSVSFSSPEKSVCFFRLIVIAYDMVEQFSTQLFKESVLSDEMSIESRPSNISPVNNILHGYICVFLMREKA